MLVQLLENLRGSDEIELKKTTTIIREGCETFDDSGNVCFKDKSGELI